MKHYFLASKEEKIQTTILFDLIKKLGYNFSILTVYDILIEGIEKEFSFKEIYTGIYKQIKDIENNTFVKQDNTIFEEIKKIKTLIKEDKEKAKIFYKKLAHKYHPDKNNGNKQKEEYFKTINNLFTKM